MTDVLSLFVCGADCITSEARKALKQLLDGDGVPHIVHLSAHDVLATHTPHQEPQSRRSEEIQRPPLPRPPPSPPCCALRCFLPDNCNATGLARTPCVRIARALGPLRRHCVARSLAGAVTAPAGEVLHGRGAGCGHGKGTLLHEVTGPRSRVPLHEQCATTLLRRECSSAPSQSPGDIQ